MNSSDVLNILDQIAATSSRTEKERLLEANVSDPMFQKVLKYAYDPFITFGLTPPLVEAEGKRDFDINTVSIWATLDALAGRAITGGNAAQTVLELLLSLAPASAELLWRILAKDLRCGIAPSTINKVMPGTIPTFDVMLAHKFEPKRIKVWPAITEPKLDGVRVICLVKDGRAQFFSRSGKPFPGVDHLAPAVVKMLKLGLRDSIARGPVDGLNYAAMLQDRNKTLSIALDGEITTGGFNKTVGEVRRKDEQATDAVYSIFDAVPLDVMTGDEKEFAIRYAVRRQFVHWLVGCQKDAALRTLPSYFVNSVDEIQAYYQSFRDEGLEGAIVKPIDAPYQKKRSYGWLKMKNEETEDLRAIGWFEGEAGTKLAGKFGGLIFDREGVEVNVGSGYSDELRTKLLPIVQKLTRDLEAYTERGKVKRKFAEPWRLGEIEFHEVTPDGSLRHPRFIRFRDDKDTSEREAA